MTWRGKEQNKDINNHSIGLPLPYYVSFRTRIVKTYDYVRNQQHCPKFRENIYHFVDNIPIIRALIKFINIGAILHTNAMSKLKKNI